MHHLEIFLVFESLDHEITQRKVVQQLRIAFTELHFQIYFCIKTSMIK